jgi:hypothetical protein
VPTAPCDRPSISRYKKGCRCDGCREINTKWFAAYRNRGSMPQVERLSVTCWCEAHYKQIPATEVAAGRTWSCGLGCSGP